MKLADRASVEFKPLRRACGQDATIFLKGPVRLRKVPQEADRKVWRNDLADPSCHRDRNIMEKAPFGKASSLITGTIHHFGPHVSLSS